MLLVTSVEKIIDVFAMLGDITASGAEEIGEALQKVASTAENSGVSLEKSSIMDRNHFKYN